MNIYDFILDKLLEKNSFIFSILIKKFKTSEKILKADNDEIFLTLKNQKISEEKIIPFLEKKSDYNKNPFSCVAILNGEIKKIRNFFNLEIISFSDKEYPSQLKEISDPPINLYMKGDINFDYLKSIAIVGRRNLSAYARDKISEIAKDLAKKGFCILSGLAIGSDTQAQSSAIIANGKTIAVLPFISNKIYPQENTFLAKEILSSGGALISEDFTPETVYDRSLFTGRNRIISGLSRAILIAEGTKISGSFSQYNHAKRQGKIIFTLKPIGSHEGTYLPKKIIREGGYAIESADEIIDILQKKEKSQKDNDEKIKILSFLERIQQKGVNGLIIFFEWLNKQPQHYKLIKWNYSPLIGKPHSLNKIEFLEPPKELINDINASVLIDTLTKETDGYLFEFINPDLIKLSDIGIKVLRILINLKEENSL